MKDWRDIVGEKWEIGALAEYVNKERWDTFVKENLTLIYYATLDYENSRERLALILDDVVKWRKE